MNQASDHQQESYYSKDIRIDFLAWSLWTVADLELVADSYFNSRRKLYDTVTVITK